MMDGSLSELQDGSENLGCLNDSDKGELSVVGILPSSTTPYSLPQNCLGIVLVDASSRPLQLTTVGSDLNHVNYSTNAFLELPERSQSAIAIPGIFQQVPASEIDEDSVGAVYHAEPDVCENLPGESLLHQTELTVDTPIADSTQNNVTSEPKKNTEPVKKKGGWPKGKRRKETPVLEVRPPKPPPTGYVLFAITRRSEIKEEHPELIFSEVTKMLGYEWTNLDPVKKQKYLDEADELKRKYQEELKAFNESDAYKNMLQKKRKLNGNGIIDSESCTKDRIEDDVTNLYCEVCDMYFTSSHNKREHLFGRLHLQNVSGEIHRQEKSKQLELEEQHNSRLGDSDYEQTDGPLDIHGFINSFRAQNHERQHELSRLKQTVKLAREENNSLYKQITELKNYENRLNADLESSKQVGQTIINQAETLKMIASSLSAMFGLLNYNV